MFALLQAHCQNYHVDLSDFLRASYQAKFGKDMPQNALSEDVRNILRTQNTPNYVVDMLLKVYGTH